MQIAKLSVCVSEVRQGIRLAVRAVNLDIEVISVLIVCFRFLDIVTSILHVSEMTVVISLAYEILGLDRKSVV